MGPVLRKAVRRFHHQPFFSLCSRKGHKNDKYVLWLKHSPDCPYRRPAMGCGPNPSLSPAIAKQAIRGLGPRDCLDYDFYFLEKTERKQYKEYLGFLSIVHLERKKCMKSFDPLLFLLSVVKHLSLTDSKERNSVNLL